MSLVESTLVWIVSFLAFAIILYFCYRISYKLGIKKALYRTTYILLSIIFAFAIAPVVTNQLINLDLTEFNVVFTYKDKTCTTVIDYIEEVIAHSEFLNDLYYYFPSLKQLFMDFPQVLIAPVIYVGLFLLFMIIWLPLYLYLSYKRKRRVLYEREDNKKHRVWAGILGMVQMIFVTSVILTPVNGINRIYQNSIQNTLNEEYESLCDGNEFLGQHKEYCDALELYDSSVLASLGSNKSLNNYIFDSLTKVSYNGGKTTLSQEASLIIKSSIVLSQSGLLDVISDNEESIPMKLLLSGNFEDGDIQIIIDTLSNSKYSEGLLLEVEELAYNTLNDLLRDITGNDTVSLNVNMTREEAIEEIKIVLKILPILASTTLVEDIIEVKDKIEYFVHEVPENKKDDRVVFAFLTDVFEDVDIENLELVCEYLLESKLVNSILPSILDSALGSIGFNFTATEGDILDQVYNFIDLGKLLVKYKPIDFFDFIQSLNDEEMMIVADIINYVCSSPDSRGVIKLLFGELFRNFDYYPLTEILNISDWTKEIYVARDICAIVEGILYEDYVDKDLIIKVWKNKDSELAEAGRLLLKNNSNYLIKEIIKGMESE